MAAIYQWFPGLNWILTSTIYAVELKDGVELSIHNTSGRMEPPWIEGVNASVSFRSAEVTQVLLTENMEDEGVDMNLSFRSAVVTSVLLTENMDNEGVDTTITYISAVVTLRKVTALLPEEGVDFDLTCINGSMSLS